MVIAREMQDAVDQEEKNFLFGLFLDFQGMMFGRLCGYDHISQEFGLNPCRFAGGHRKRNYIGGAVAVKIPAVQPGDFFIVHEDDAQLMARQSQGV